MDNMASSPTSIVVNHDHFWVCPKIGCPKKSLFKLVDYHVPYQNGHDDWG
jgi:hypothetical protein